MRNFVFHNPTRILFGKGQADAAGAETAALGGRILLVTGSQSARRTGLYDRVMRQLEKRALEVFELSGVEPNPDISSVRRGAKLCGERGVQAVLALGGGSVIDAAKVMAAGAHYDGDPWDFLLKTAKPEKILPLGVILTLSATGSEANGNAVISNAVRQEKRAVYHPGMYPRFSILDPELTYTVPPRQTAYGAADIMAHVFEQYFHDVEGTELQDGFAESILRTVVRYAPEAIENPEDYTARAALMWASTLALNGLLGAGAAGDWTCHMMEHELSAKYGIAHGAGLAVVYSSWLDFMEERKARRLGRLAVNVWGVSPAGKSGAAIAREGVEAVRGFLRDVIGIGIKLSDYGIDGSRIDEMAGAIVDLKGARNLGGLTPDELALIYKNAL